MGTIAQFMRKGLLLPLDLTVCWSTGVKQPTTEVRKNGKENLPKVLILREVLV